MERDQSFKREIKSYVLRAGRLSHSQRTARDKFSSKYALPFNYSKLDFQLVFHNSHPTYLEIGFGMGDATISIAKQFPKCNFVGIEVHPPGVGRVMSLCEKNNLRNLKVIEHDAVEVVQNMFDRESLSGIHIFFPDPWPKKRHHKRRLINTRFIELITPLLVRRGYLHVATDWNDYAEEIISKVNNAENHLQKASQNKSLLSARPKTKFETRGIERGHKIWDLIFQRS